MLNIIRGVIAQQSTTTTPITFRDATTNGAESTSSVIVNKPTGVVDNDVMIAFVYSNGTATVTPPSGWNLISSVGNTGTWTANAYLYYKVASSEGASYTWSFSASTRARVSITAYGNIDTVTPIDDSDFRAQSSGEQPSTNVVTATSNNSMLLIGNMWDTSTARTHTVPSGYTLDIDTGGTGPTFMCHELVSSGNTTSETITSSPLAGAATCATFSLIISPA